MTPESSVQRSVIQLHRSYRDLKNETTALCRVRNFLMPDPFRV